MPHYPAFVDGEAGAYGVTFPDLPGIVAMGETVEDALMNAEEVLRDYVAETDREGAQAPDASSIETMPLRDGSVLVALPASASVADMAVKDLRCPSSTAGSKPLRLTKH